MSKPPDKDGKTHLKRRFGCKKGCLPPLKRVYDVYNNKKRYYGYDRKNKRNRRIKSFI